MDTTTVNFAINKLSEGWQKVAPTIKDVGAKYVEYVVTKEIILGGIAVFFLLVSIAAFIWSLRFTKARWEKATRNYDQPPYVALCTVMGLFVLGSIIGVMAQGFSTLLALTNPEMYVVHELMRAAR